MPDLTFVVAAFNAQRTLARTLGSLATVRAPGRVDVLVIDDGSTDRTAAIVAGFCASDPMFRGITQTNRGLGAVRNRGLAEARGNYVTFCDADDMFLPDNHLRLVDRMQRETADVAVGQGFCLIQERTMSEFWDNDAVRLLHHLGNADERHVVKYLLQPSACTKIFRRAYAQENALQFTEGRLFEDVAFTTGALMLTERVIADELPLFIYDVHRDGSITSESSARRLEILDNLVPLLATLAGRGMPAAERLALLTGLMRTALWCLDNLPAALIGQFKARLVTMFDPLAADAPLADRQLVLGIVTDRWDRRAFAVIEAMASSPAGDTRRVDDLLMTLRG
jgi:hypothetical protein